VVRIRPIGPADKDALRGTYERMSPESRYRRFFAAAPELSESMVVYFTEVDHHDHEALIALDAGGDDLVGVSRFVRSPDDPEIAEVAIAVVDAWHGRGLGRALLERLAGRARQEGIRRFSATVLSDNPRAIRVVSSLGECERSRDGAYMELRVELPARRGIGTSLNRLLRETATGSVVVVGGAVRHAVTSAQARPHGDAASPPRPSNGELRTIVVGTDGSATAERAVEQAVVLATRFGARLHVVSAYGLAGASVPEDLRAVPDGLSDLGWQVTGADGAEAVLARTVAAIERPGLDTVTHARRGDPAQVLLSVAEEEAADLIVVGNKGVRSARRLVVGSVAGAVVRLAPCGVFVVRTT
jgi:nucleotide-binding universal stress UspA family protein